MEIDAFFVSYDAISRLESYANIRSLSVHLQRDRDEYYPSGRLARSLAGHPPVRRKPSCIFRRSKSELVRDIIFHNPKLRKLSLHIPQQIFPELASDEEENAIARLCPALSQIQILELQGNFRLPVSLWTSIDTDSISSLALCNLDITRAFASNLVGQLPRLRTLKVSAYPHLRQIVGTPEEANNLVNPAIYDKTKHAFLNFLSSAQIEDLTICHFDKDMLHGALRETGLTLRHFQFHAPIDIASGSHLWSPRRSPLEEFQAIGSIGQIAPHLLHLGVALSSVHVLNIRPGHQLEWPPRPPPPPSSTFLPQGSRALLTEPRREFIFPPPLPLLPFLFGGIPPPPPFPLPRIESPPLPFPKIELPPKVLSSFAGFSRLKHISLMDLSLKRELPHQVKPEDCVRAFCYLQKQKHGVILESLEILGYDIVYRVWENGPTECILTFFNHVERIEQIWERKETLKLLQENRRDRGAWMPERPWGILVLW